MDNLSIKPKITPKDFFMWLAAMVTLYWSVVAFIFLIFGYIDYVFPNVLQYQPDPYSGSIPYEMASILVLFPIYAALMYLIRREIARDAARGEVWIRRWALILTLFVAGLTMAVDIVILLTTFFRGEELTTAFLLKFALVFLVAAVGFMHFTADLKGYWDTNRQKAKAIGIAVGVLALASVFSGFLIIGTPQHARLMRLDSQKIGDLQNIQWQGVNYWQLKQKLPQSIADLQDPISGFVAPIDPQTGQAYGYRIITPLSFELCANFNLQGGGELNKGGILVPALPRSVSEPISANVGGAYDNWAHMGEQGCFERTIDPERYPPIKK